MNQVNRALILLLMALPVLGGCGRNEPKREAKAEKALPSFKAGKGLFLPEDTRRSIGLEIADVTERKLDRHLSAEVQVYESDGPKAWHASGLAGTEKAEWVRPGQSVSLASKDGTTFQGRLTFLDGQTQLGQKEIIIEGVVGTIAPATGSFLTATMMATNGEPVTAIPSSALLRAAQGDFVYVVNGERLLRTPVSVGDGADGFVQIKDGLYAGDRVATKPVQTLWLTELRLTTAGGDSD